jgi:hypothetical protein
MWKSGRVKGTSRSDEPDKRASDVKPTQKKAIKRSKQIEPKSKPRVERVRKTAKGGPDKWRSP